MTVKIRFNRNQRLVDSYIQRSGGYFELNRMAKKIREEAKEVADALSKDSNIEEEIGDLMFTTLALANRKQIDANIALKKSIRKFVRRGDIQKLVAQKVRS
jgi:phosphoribosyl-ATP pyrophosphohydrolase